SSDHPPISLQDLAALGALYANVGDAATHLTWMEERTWLVQRADGTQRAISVQPAPLRDPVSGEIVGAVHTLQSVQSWYDQDATKEEFLSVASHELRAPLQPLILASRFIQRWIDRPEHHVELATLADQIVQQSKRLSQLVLDMINMTRINSGVFVIERGATDVAKIVRDVVAEHQSLTKRDITLVGADAPIPMQADDEKLWQAFTNLISNAIKYSPAPAPVTVTLSHFTAADASPWLRVAVHDEGNGIPPEQVQHVFDRFYRAAVSKGMERQQQDGLGLGLYITRAIVTGHRGRIAATSVVGEGSTFTIELPLQQLDGEGAVSE
ncbi:MAG: HAMP domain-containing histidine kinase, partial [Ktedonobacterales bacterium]|nr:HAMP domain-containing histidine kinase [Ktedonobacterales bacterium]